jgi:hypothetical protein
MTIISEAMRLQQGAPYRPHGPNIVILLLLAGNTAAECKVYPQSIPQGTPLPAIRVYQSGGGPLYADDGETGLFNPRVITEVYAKDYGAAKDLARQCRGVLSGYHGTLNGVDVQAIFLDDEQDDREGGSNAAEYVYIVSQTYQIWHGD